MGFGSDPVGVARLETHRRSSRSSATLPMTDGIRPSGEIELLVPPLAGFESAGLEPHHEQGVERCLEFHSASSAWGPTSSRRWRRAKKITPFPIQALAVPEALAGRDVLAKSPTGSDKTIAFGLPLV
jgi:ATP-dependent helicase YprA (DUF1998 family)